MNAKHYLTAFALLAFASGAAFASAPINKTVPVAPDGDVRISNLAGNVAVTAWSRDEVRITGTLGSGAKKLAIERSGNGVDIHVVYPRDTSGQLQGTNLSIEVPREAHLHVNTTSAGISVVGLAGPVSLQSVSGDISARTASQRVHVLTVSGGVTIDGSAPSAQISADSVNGGVQIDGVGGAVSAHSVSGNLRVQATHPITGANLNSTSGGVTFTGALAAQGDYGFHTTSGNIALDVTGTQAASFNATTFSGDITTNFGPKPHRQSQYAPGKVWRFTSGAGGARVDIATFSGNIRVHAAHR